MANNKLSEGVGKKIVEALKKQSEIEITPLQANEDMQTDLNEILQGDMDDFSISEPEEDNSFESEDLIADYETLEAATPVFARPTVEDEEETFPQFSQPMNTQIENTFTDDSTNFEMPSNIAVLKKLITQLPSGVTRHTGALIIRQTMEALGISMKSVLQEAQQVQEGLSTSAKSCHSSIVEYKKQIAQLEKQSQSYQKQYSALNELISLFIQTT